MFNGGNNIEFGLAIVYSIISVVGCGIITLYMKKKEKKLSSELQGISDPGRKKPTDTERKTKKSPEKVRYDNLFNIFA